MKPKLRFKEFSDEWEEKKLGDITSKKGSKNDETSCPICSVSNKFGLILQENQFDKCSYSKTSKDSYKKVLPQEFAYNPAV